VTQNLRRALHRITTPTGYLLLLGSGQIAWLWTERIHFASWVPAAATLGLIALLAWLRFEGRWAGKYAGILALIGLMTIAPLVSTMVTRTQLGLSFENDGLAKAEVATDRLLQGKEIYGIDWHGTQVEGYSHIWNGREVRHFNHLPMSVLVAIPVRVVTRALGMTFDYRMVLLLFVLIGMVAVSLLPIPLPARFLTACALFCSPVLPVMTITGHDDIMYVVMIVAGIALLARGRVLPACLAFGMGAALKPFGAVALPLALISLWQEWRRSSVFPRRQAALCLVASVAPAVLSIVPFLLWNAGAFWRDVVLFTNGGIPDAYPMTGFGLSGILVALGLLNPTGYFPFLVLQLCGVGVVYWFAWRRAPEEPTLGRFMGLYTGAFLVFAFLARFFVDNYLAALLSLALCILPLGAAPLLSRRGSDSVDGDRTSVVNAA
jgi:hypothetical protein